MKRIFKLCNDYNHSGDTEMDASHLDVRQNDRLDVIMTGVSEADLPAVLYFTANFHLIPKYDFPLTDLLIPVLSKRMLSIINDLGAVRYRKVDIIMLDDTYLDGHFDMQGNLKSEVAINRDYVAIQLMDYTDAFNFKVSEYTAVPDHPNRARLIRNLVLREPPAGFPPIFKIKQMSSSLFITESTREALEANKIVGCAYSEVMVSDA